jgi:hypothetical protein
MFLRRSQSGVVIELNPFRVLLARLTRLGGATAHVEDLAEVAADDRGAFDRELQRLFPERKSYTPGICSVFSPTRLLQREEVNVKRLAEPDYLPSLISDQYKVEAAKWRLVLVNPFEGYPFDEKHPPIKEVLICGESREELMAAQRRFLDLGVLPRRMEVASLPALGGIQSYQALHADGQPAAVVELDLQRTRVFILGKNGVNTPAPIEFGFDALVEIARKELATDDGPGVRARLLAGDAELVTRAPRLLRPLIRNLKPAIDYFELQTGQRVNDLYCTFLPPNLDWLSRALAAALEMRVLAVDCARWLEALRITAADGIPARLGPHWLSLLSLIAPLNPASYAKKGE